MGRSLTRVLVCAVGATLMSLAGCDSTPNPNFEQAMKEKSAGKVGDPYAMLSTTPARNRYLQQAPEARLASAVQQATSIRTSYSTLLRKLDTDPAFAKVADLVGGCRPIFDKVVLFHGMKGLDAAAAQAQGTAVFGELSACRERAIAAGQSGDDSVANPASLLKRFASTGMVLASISMVAHGDETNGLELWGQAEKLAADDKPGFELTPGMFRPRG